jgi:hypothetical protein
VRVRKTILQPLNLPQAVRVVASASGAPQSVDGVRVVELLDRWRVDDTWWREPLCRMYFQVLLVDERTLTIYHDRIAGTWHRQPYGEPGMPGFVAPRPPEEVRGDSRDE